MPNYSIGAFIKHRRNELKISQSELCCGICNVGTLSRIENGELLPKSEIAELILQRLGYSSGAFDGFLTDKDFTTAQTIQKAKNLTSLGKNDEARAVIEELSRDYESLRLQDKQYCDRTETVFLNLSGAITDERALKNLISILERSTGRFNLNELPKVVGFEEMCLLNNIALCYAHVGRTDAAINILYHMKEINERNIVDQYESMKSLPGILYNLSKYLGLSGRYDESIALCEQSIALLKQTGLFRLLPQTMYDLGWSLFKRGRAEDLERARKIMNEAYRLSSIISGDGKLTRHISKFIAENFK